MKVVAVVGTKKTGKTTVVTALVRTLSRRWKVGTIKNMAHHSMDRGDTRRHFEAGADAVIGLGEARLKVTRDRGDLESALAELEEDGMEIVIVEGFKQSSLPKIVLGELDVPNTIRKISIYDLNDDLIGELAGQVLGLEDFKSQMRTQ